MKTVESNNVCTERNCPICGTVSKKMMGKIELVNFEGNGNLFDNQEIAVCEKCGFVYHVGFDMHKLDDYYAYYSGWGGVKQMSEDEEVLNNNMADFVQLCLKTPLDSMILDVGCGQGWVLSLLQERGYKNLSGIDTDIILMENLKSRNVNVQSGNIYSKDLFHEEYDVVILKMVMEHLEDPAEAVENVKGWLKKDGVLIIEVPDCSLYDRAAFFRGYFQSVNMEHINNFSIISLMNLMKNWRLLACESTESNGIFPVLRAAFRFEPGYERALVYNEEDEKAIWRSLHIRSGKGKLVEEKIESLKNKTIVIWGISAFTRGLLSYTALAEQDIKCFIDNNKFFQGKKLLGRKIIAPSDYEGNEVIVIPGKNSANKIMDNIKELGLSNKIVCLSEL